MVKRRRRRRHPCAANKAGFSPPAPNGPPPLAAVQDWNNEHAEIAVPAHGSGRGGGGACTPATRVSVSVRARACRRERVPASPREHFNFDHFGCASVHPFKSHSSR